MFCCRACYHSYPKPPAERKPEAPLPTLQEIMERAALIRAGWDAEADHLTVPPTPWVVPVVTAHASP